MLLPKGQIVYENLNTSFTRLDALLNELQNDQLTGYVQVTDWEYEGILLMDTGKMVNALEEAGRPAQRRSGPKAAESILAQAREKGGTISVYRLSEEMVQLVGALLKAEPVYRDLASDFTSLDKLMLRLENEKHTGHIEIRMTTSPDTATIFMRDGQTAASLFSHNGSIASGSPALSQILHAASAGAVFTVYRADLEKAYGDVTLSDSFARQGTLALWQDLLQSVETTVDKIKGAEAFLTAFKRAAIEQAPAFPFLDPFAGEFAYRRGVIQFQGQATLEQFNQGLCQALAQTIRSLAAEGNPLDLVQLRREMAGLKTKYGARLQENGIASAVPELFES